MSATHPQPTESIFLVPHSIIIMIQVMWPCRNCRYWWCCLWSASGHCQRRLHSVDSTRMCMDREITINLVGNLPRRSPGAGNSFQVLQCPVLHRLMCRVFVLCYPKLWKWGSSGQVCPGGLVSNSCFFFCCWHWVSKGISQPWFKVSPVVLLSGVHCVGLAKPQVISL